MADGSGFVSPRPQVNIEGSARAALSDGALEVTVRVPADGMASAEVRVVNWGPPEAGGAPDFLFADVTPGQKIELSFGLLSDRKLFRGEITAVEERYGDGAPQLVLLAEDGLFRLARKRRSRAFENRSPDDILRSLAGDAGLGADVSVSSTTGSWNQLNESDLALARQLARLFGARLRFDGTRLVCRLPEPPPAPIELDTGDTLKRVRLLADLARIPAKGRAVGWDLSAGNAVQGEASATRASPNGQTPGDLLQRIGWNDDAVFTDPPPPSQGTADAYAAAAYDTRARRFVAGDIVCVGNAAVVNGAAVKLKGVSKRLLGVYDVAACLHHFSLANGYETYARIERGWWN